MSEMPIPDKTLAIHPGPLHGSLRAPSSKSITNRLLAMTALAEGESEVRHPLLCDDTYAMAAGLGALGVEVSLAAERATVAGSGGQLHPTGQVVDAALSGTTLRFLAALSLLADRPVVLDGAPGLRRRPIGALFEALERCGARVESNSGLAPFTISSSGLEGGRIVVDAAKSSQFATALLLVAPYAKSDVELVVKRLGAGGYVELTVALMGELGARVERTGQTSFLVPSGSGYRSGSYEAGYDASAAAHLFAAAVASGGELTVTNAGGTLQPDAAVVDVLGSMGALVRRGEAGGVTVAAPPGGLRPVEADLAPMPDQLPTLAVLAALAPGESRFSGLSVSRGHESDRPRAVADELARLGGEVEIEGDLLVVRGGRPLAGGVVESYGDHRMAMAFSALGTAVEGLVIAGADCVTKTYPGWWEDLARLGARLEAL